MGRFLWEVTDEAHLGALLGLASPFGLVQVSKKL
jgi:hypothetical protein